MTCKDIAGVITDAAYQYEPLHNLGFFDREENVQKSTCDLSPLLRQEVSTTENSTIPLERLRGVRSSRFADKRFSKIYIPLARALAYMTLFYKEKYNIDIFLSTPESIHQLVKHATENRLPAFGTIIFWDQEKEHTSPLLFKKRANSISWEAVLMDSVGNQFPCSNGCLRLLHNNLLANGVILFINRKLRQADDLSCHTDSLIILRNALLDIGRRKKMFDFDHAIQGRLPHQWNYTSQIRDIDEPNMTIVRDTYSTKKRDCPKKKREFDSIYKQKTTIEETFSAHAPQHLLSFTSTRETERNLYLLYKGAHMLSKIGENPTRYSYDALNGRCIGFELAGEPFSFFTKRFPF